MNTNVPVTQSFVTTLFREILLPLFPRALHEEIERELPTLGLLAYQLGVDVLVAERQGLKYSEAVKKPEFLKMGRVYFGATNLLQWQLPAPVWNTLRAVLSQVIQGKLEPTHALLFAIASRKNDPEAALWRFLLWVAVRINLLVLTWEDPGVELRGSLDEAEDEAETALRNLLEIANSEMQEPDCRPLHMLMADTVVHMYLYDQTVILALSEFKSEIQELLTDADALEKVRSLDARAAAVFRPGPSEVELGSQQIADRFPQHFSSANAMEQHRSRVRKRVRKMKPATDRFIDLLRAAMGDAS